VPVDTALTSILKVPSGLIKHPAPVRRSPDHNVRDDKEAPMSGIVIRTSPIRRVEFVCPRCGIDRDGNIADQQRWFVALGVPLVPLAKLDPVVRCGTCSHRSGIGVLTVPTAAALSDMLNRAMRHSIATIVRHGDGAPSADVERFAVGIMRKSGFPYESHDLERDLGQLTDQGTAPHMRPLADELTAHGKQGLLHRLHALAALTGGPTATQRASLVRIGVALGMAAPHINGVLAAARRHDATTV
jgi:hypothetical protein